MLPALLYARMFSSIVVFLSAFLKVALSRSTSSAPGCPYDNSVCGSFFKYLKKEETDRYRYRTFEQLSVSILGYIDGYYNSRRLHSSIGYMTPNEKDASFYRKG